MDYLEAIQAIPGQTPGEKFKHINLTAKNIAENKCQDVNFPKPLESLLHVEVAKLTYNTIIIVEALITSDSLLCQRALQIPDLFLREDSPLLNWEYFNNQLLSRVSFTTRCKIIKKLSTDLQRKDPKIAEEFYLNISKLYGNKPAQPLLLACSKEFVLERIKENGLILTERNVERLFQKDPELIATYLSWINRMMYERLSDYNRFLPNLVDNHFDLFVNLLEERHETIYLRMTLGKRRTKTFLQKGKQLLIEKPLPFLKYLSLDAVSKKLSVDEWTIIMAKLYSKQKMSTFGNNYYYGTNKVSSLLKHFPDEKKVVIVLAAFKKAYGQDLCDHPDLIDYNLLSILPTELRIKVARMKLATEPDWSLFFLEKSWKIYLAFDEIFEDVKSEITKSSDPNEKEGFVKILILCCKKNKDADALLQVLKYVRSCHRTESDNFWFNIMETIGDEFRLELLEQEHWDIFMEILKDLEHSGDYRFEEMYSTILPWAIRFKILNKLDPDDYLRYYLKLSNSNTNFNIFLTKSLKSQKDCLAKFLILIVNECSSIREKDALKTNCIALDKLFSTIFKYNEIVKSKSKGLPLIKLEDYPSVIKILDEIVKCYNFNKIKSYAKCYSPTLYTKWFFSDVERNAEEKKVIGDYDYELTRSDVKLLQKNLSQYVSEWDTTMEYLSRCKEMKSLQSFVQRLRWFQDLPIRLTNFCLTDRLNCPKLAILSILFNSSEFQKFIEQLWLQKTDSEERTEQQWQITKFFRKGIFTDPLLPLNYIMQFISHDDIHHIKAIMDRTACRTPVPAVNEFVSTCLSDEHFEVVKKMIGLVSLVAPIEYRFEIYRAVLSSPAHGSSIQEFIVLKVLKMFRNDPSTIVLNFLSECIEDGDIEDRSVFEQLCSLKKIPPGYLEPYVKRMVSIFEKVQGKDLFENLSHTLISQIIGNLYTDITFSTFLSNEFLMDLIETYIFKSEFDSNPSLDNNFIFSVFLENKRQERIDLLLTFLEEYVGTYYGKPMTKGGRVLGYPGNKNVRFVIGNFVSLGLKGQVDVSVIDRLLALFNGPIDPLQDLKLYFFLVWIKIYIVVRSPKRFGIEFGNKLDSWVDKFGSGFLYRMTPLVPKFLNVKLDEWDLSEPTDCLTEFISGLWEVQKDNSCIVIAILITKLPNCPEKEFLITELKKTKIPMVLSLLYDGMYNNVDSL